MQNKSPIFLLSTSLSPVTCHAIVHHWRYSASINSERSSSSMKRVFTKSLAFARFARSSQNGDSVTYPHPSLSHKRARVRIAQPLIIRNDWNDWNDLNVWNS